MTDKGLVYARARHGRPVCALVPTAPGTFEDPLMIGDLPGADMERLGQVWTRCDENGWGRGPHGPPTNFARVLLDRGSVAEQVTVLPFEEAARYIDQATHVSLGNCSFRLAQQGGDRPIDVCWPPSTTRQVDEALHNHFEAVVDAVEVPGTPTTARSTRAIACPSRSWRGWRRRAWPASSPGPPGRGWIACGRACGIWRESRLTSCRCATGSPSRRW